MRTLFSNSVTTENADTITSRDPFVNTLRVEVYDEGSWSGSIKFAARLRGSSEAFTHFLAVVDLDDNSSIQGTTGITVPGLYAVDISGMEVQAQHTRTIGSMSANATLLRG